VPSISIIPNYVFSCFSVNYNNFFFLLKDDPYLFIMFEIGQCTVTRYKGRHYPALPGFAIGGKYKHTTYYVLFKRR
jgi:hypothetical protein